jgi:hypothetical protein
MLVAGLLACLAAPAPAAAPDRLELFRTLTRDRLGAATSAAERERAVSELYEVVDAEVLDSLRGGETFASLVFIRERLEALTEAWGGATLRVLRIPGAGGRPPLTIGLYTLSGVEGSGSLRLFAGMGATAALAASSTQDGLLDAQAWPVGSDRVARVLALWSGPPTAHGARPVRAELWETRERVQRVWSTAAQWPDGLWATDWRSQPGELIIRYSPPYPGWKPACPGQTEQEDHYRLTPAGGFALARRQVSNGWHRELGAAADRVFRALAGGDERLLAQLVPAPALRARLPRSLVPEPVCEQAAGPRGVVTVAATELRDGRRVPWALSWTRTPAGWRLHAAAPVLQ